MIEFFLIEIQTTAVRDFIGKEFGQFSIVEHFGAYTRFKIETDIPTGKIFGNFEKNKETLELASYSVK